MKNNKLFLLFIAFVVVILGVSALMRELVLNRLDTGSDVVNQNTTEPARGYPELTSETIISGLTNVWDVAFLPDDTIIFSERIGTLSKVFDGQKQIIATIPAIVARGEGGLMGISVDPDFANNRFVYACYNTKNDIRVSRWKLNEDVNALSDQKDIVTGMPSIPSGRHSGCRPVFGADGNLWIGTGDAATGTNPQDPISLGGKILRVDRDGNGVSGNLNSPFDNRIYSYGHRNTQGLAMFDSPRNGSYGISLEHGSSRDDEANALVPGNFGWDPIPGYNEATDMTDEIKYPDAIKAIWSSGPTTIATGGGVIVKGSKWQLYENNLWIGVLKDKHIILLELSKGGDTLVGEKKLFENQFGRIRSITQGPFRDIYLTTDNGAGKDSIIKIQPN